MAHPSFCSGAFCVRLSVPQATASVSPQLWQPSSGSVMTNDTSDATSAGSDDACVACVALSKNDSYVMSASGGKVSLFNLLTFKVSDGWLQLDRHGLSSFVAVKQSRGRGKLAFLLLCVVILLPFCVLCPYTVFFELVTFLNLAVR